MAKASGMEKLGITLVPVSNIEDALKAMVIDDSTDVGKVYAEINALVGNYDPWLSRIPLELWKGPEGATTLYHSETHNEATLKKLIGIRDQIQRLVLPPKREEVPELMAKVLEGSQEEAHDAWKFLKNAVPKLLEYSDYLKLVSVQYQDIAEECWELAVRSGFKFAANLLVDVILATKYPVVAHSAWLSLRLHSALGRSHLERLQPCTFKTIQDQIPIVMQVLEVKDALRKISDTVDKLSAKILPIL